MVVDVILPLPFVSCLWHFKAFLSGGEGKNIIQDSKLAVESDLTDQG